MNWERTIERYPEVLVDQGVDPDPFDYLHKQVLGDQEPRLHAELEYSARKSIPINGGDNGWATCEVKVRIVCPQTERHINVAGEIAFIKAAELVHDGLSHMTGG